jgi:hypothetical protein
MMFGSSSTRRMEGIDFVAYDGWLLRNSREMQRDAGPRPFSLEMDLPHMILDDLKNDAETETGPA